MKITDDIVRALQGCVESLGSKSALAMKANVNVETIGRYLSKQTKTIADDTWDQIYPVLKPYLPKSFDMDKNNDFSNGKGLMLTSDQKILLDAFAELPENLKKKKLLEITELAKTEILKKKNSD
ncbi:MAG: hypothetical protein A2017_08820 [Lentisphaerae bacterium GWF2_44_16]|nr:MAG: hypothetical protein A2017_08820 [Lentisphaerae bacterium GWF2_44_16]